MNYLLAQLLGVAHSYMPIRKIREYQYRKLRRVLLEAQHCTYYRRQWQEIGFDPRRDFKRIEDIERLPLLERDTVRYNRPEFVNLRYPRTTKCRTSGTTGEPMTTYTTARQEIVEQSTVYRAWREAGYRLGDPVAIIRSYVPKQGEPLWYHDKRRNWLYLSAYHIRGHEGQYLNVLDDFRPRIMRGYPSSLFLLATSGMAFRPNLRGVISSSETLPPDWIPVLERYYGAPVFNWYGQAERTAVIYKRRDAEMYVAEWYGYAEQIDGEIIATNLHNYAFPLIRYRTGDVAGPFSDRGIHAPHRCVASIQGRRADIIRGVPSVNFYTLFYELGARSWQLQETAQGVRVYVEGAHRHEVEYRLRERLDCDIEFTDTVITTRDGKRRAIVPLAKQ